MNTTDPPMAIPPPMPLYTFPRSRTPDAPPMTGFAHSLPVIRHRMSKAKLRRGKPLREPLQDPRRGLLLAHWFGVRDREENELSVAKAERGGLSGSYFNNRWLYGEAVYTRVDSLLDFSWTADDTLTPTGKDYISVRWEGFVLPPFSEQYTFTVTAMLIKATPHTDPTLHAGL